MLELLKKLCNAFGPSGLEDAVRGIILNEIRPYTQNIRIDRAGNLIAFKKGKNTPRQKLLLSAHMDEIGFMATHIDEKGFVKFGAVGGIDQRVVGAKRVMLRDGTTGVVSSKAIHLKPQNERGLCLPINKMQIDFGCVSYEDTLKRVAVGDLMTFAPNFTEFGEGMIASKAIDDRLGCTVLCDIIKSELEYDTWFAFTVCEEVGCRGAKGVAFAEKADIAAVVEATTAGDIHGVTKPATACCLGEGAVLSFMDGATLYEQNLIRNVMELAVSNDIKAQYKTVVAGGNEAGTYQHLALPARVFAVSAPVRYIHSANSVAAVSDMTAVRDLLLKFIERGF